MRRIRGLWQQITSMENLERAASKACSSRKDKKEVAEFLANKDELLRCLQNQLIYRKYEPSEFYLFEKVENGKKRLVSDQPLYPDRIAHWAVALVVEPEVDRRFIPQSHASRKGHGTHSAVANVRRYIDSDERIQYALKVDVKQFFPSIDKDVAKRVVSRVIKDPDVLWFIGLILDSYPLKGIPLGNRLSPMIANLILSYALDYPLKEQHHVHYYVRFMDDAIVLGYSKPWLHKIRKVMAAQLEEYGLTMKQNWQVFPIDDRGIDFVGYRIFRTKTLLRKSTKLRMRKASTRLQAKVDAGDSLDKHDQGTVWSYHGILMACDSRQLDRKTIAPLVRQIESQKRWAKGMAAWCNYTALCETGVLIA